MDVKKILGDDSAPAVALLGAVLNKYGTEALSWDLDTLIIEIKEDFNLELSEINYDKLLSAIIVLTTDAYSTSWQVFETITHHFCNQHDDFDTFNLLEWDDLALGLCDATMIRHEPFDWSNEVKLYVGFVLKEFGMTKPPDIFSEAIIPDVCECENEELEQEKNQALLELVQTRKDFVLKYIERNK